MKYLSYLCIWQHAADVIPKSELNLNPETFCWGGGLFLCRCSWGLHTLTSELWWHKQGLSQLSFLPSFSPSCGFPPSAWAGPVTDVRSGSSEGSRRADGGNLKGKWDHAHLERKVSCWEMHRIRTARWSEGPHKHTLMEKKRSQEC